MDTEKEITEERTLAQEIELYQQYADITVQKETENLNSLIDIVNSAMTLREVNGEIESSSKLTIDELEILAMKIPAECSRLQTRLNQFTIHNSFKDLELDALLAANTVDLIGSKGTAEERRKKAELAIMSDKVKNLTNKMIIKGIQGTIDRADKTYEGVKKVIDSRSKEGFFDRKQVDVPRSWK